MTTSKKTILGTLGCAVALAIGACSWWLYSANKRVEAVNLVIEGNPSDEQLVSFLKSSDRILLSNTLYVLERRRAAGGRELAASLLKHPDPYVWYSASLYLGALGDPRSIPYLIRGLDHPAWRSRPRVVNYLKTLTGQDYDERKAAWIEWWSAQHLADHFDFTILTNGATNRN